MKKSKKSWKALIAMIVIAFISVACATVVYAATHFWSTYGTTAGGALYDGILTKDEWNALMTDLDGMSCKSCCPDCPSCDGTCTEGVLSRDDSRILEVYEYGQGLYNGAGQYQNIGIVRAGANNEAPCGGNKTDWTRNTSSFNKSSTYCAVINNQCSTVNWKIYYIRVGNNRYEIRFTGCASSSYGNQYAYFKVQDYKSLTKYCISMWPNSTSNIFSTYDIVKK